MIPKMMMWIVAISCVLAAIISYIWWLVLTTRVKPCLQNHNGRWRRPLGDTMELYFHLMDNVMTLGYCNYIVAKGPLPLSLMSRALESLSERHPLLRARCVKDNGEYFFEDMDDFHTPLSVCNDDTWLATYERQLFTNYDCQKGPLWRCVLLPYVHDPDYTSEEYPHQVVLIFGFYHSIIDGTASVQLVAELMSILNKMMLLDENSHTREMTQKASVPLSMDMLVPQMRKTWKELLLENVLNVSIFRRLMFAFTKTLNPTNIWVEKYGTEQEKNSTCDKKTTMLTMVSSRKQTAKLLERCKQHKVTPQGFIVSVTTIAFAKLYDGGQVKNKLHVADGCHVSVSARRRFPNNIPDNMLAAAFAMIGFPVSVDPDWKDQFWIKAKEYTNFIHHDLKGQVIRNVHNTRYENTLLKHGFQRISKDTVRYECLFACTNVGDISFVNKSESKVKLAARFSGCSEHQIGAMATCGTTTIDGQMFWSINYYTNIWKSYVAQEFVNLIEETLNEVLE